MPLQIRQIFPLHHGTVANSAFFFSKISTRRLPTQIGILITLFLTPMWWRWSNPPVPFTPNYVMGFRITAAMLATIIIWMLSGFPGLYAFVQDKWPRLWIASLLTLLGWVTISQTWAFGLVSYSGLAPNAALQLALVSLFAITTACAAPAPRVVIRLLIVALVVHSIIGGLQVVHQGAIGLSSFGELDLDVARSGVSVIQSGTVRWLRPYGLQSHPNIYAGNIVVGLLASTAWIPADGKKRWIGIGVFALGFWMLLLSFSRGAWVGFAGGVLFALSFVMRQTHFWKRILPVVGLAIALGITFLMLYRPLLLSRVGVGSEGIELRSVSDRLVYMRIAREAIREYPIQGVGAGNFPWYASVYIFYNTDYDLRGDNVHNIYLGVWSELGLVGVTLFGLMFGSGIVTILKQRDIERLALLAGVVAFAVIGFVDHYPWTLVQSQTLWFGLLAVGMSVNVQQDTPEMHA